VLKKIMLLTATALVLSAGPLAVLADEDAQAGSPDRVEEVVVTAQRTSQNLQVVPISVSAITAAALERQGVTNTEAMTLSVPGLDVSRTSNGVTPFIRGVGSSYGSAGAESPVAIYVDGVYRPTPQGDIFSLNNIERVEVLKGPQGTLFGRNATGGVIQIITRDPSQDPEIATSVGYGNFETSQANVYATGGISRDIAIDVAGHFIDQEHGWGRDLSTGGDIFKTQEISLRSKLLWTLGDHTHVRLAVDYNRLKSDFGLNIGFAPGSIGLDGVTTFSGFYNNRGIPADSSVNRQYGGSINIDHDFDWATLVSITSYRRFRAETPYDQDGTPLPIVQITDISQRATTATQELQLRSPASSALKWIIGAFYLHDKSGYSDITIAGLAASPFPFINIAGFQTTDSYAGFGQVTAPISADTRATAGIRYTSDRRSIEGSNDLGGAVLLSGSNSETFEKPTWRLSLDHDFAPDILGYVSYNRGFKSGLFNTITYSQPAVKPEVLDAYEIGLKTELFDRRLRLNGAAFLYNYKGIQLTRLLEGAALLFNAAAARMKGIDFDFDARLSHTLSITGGATYLNGHYTSFPDAPRFTPQPTGGSLLSPFDATGNWMVRAPKVTFDIGPSLQFASDVGKLGLSVLYYHSSGFFWNADNRLRQPAYDIVNGTLSWTANSDKYAANLWVRNLLGAKYYSYAEEQTLGDNTSPAAPRTYGVTFSYRFQ
jgi:iron complex outermembrane recepter protein